MRHCSQADRIGKLATANPDSEHAVEYLKLRGMIARGAPPRERHGYTMTDCRDQLTQTSVVATTMAKIARLVELGFDSADVVIMDEASTITNAQSLLLHQICTRLIVTAGDTLQLFSTCISLPAQRNSYGAFAQLSVLEAWPCINAGRVEVVSMNNDYRSVTELMAMSNSLWCGGQMQRPIIAAQAENTVFSTQLRKIMENLAGGFMEQVAKSNRRLIFLDVGTLEEKYGDSRMNPGFSAAAVDILHALSQQIGAEGAGTGKMAFLSFYAAEVARFRQCWASKLPTLPLPEACTVDNSQGREWKLVVMSLTRAALDAALEDPKRRYGILNDARRQYIATGRAREMLIVVGNATILQKSLARHPTLRNTQAHVIKLWEYLEKHAAMVRLPANLRRSKWGGV
ncbi:AAA domain-containing protein [Massariosphaeria phaeospora]|uniref:AAA domain-containing protein n=1 Tax=Massariosphaeria phaeospora TaxID=100035 RepID=A0A7C8IDT2_9PLEO|nr:AAA domain-containing protein [Massariosphaeria phaeospora]